MFVGTSENSKVTDVYGADVPTGCLPTVVVTADWRGGLYFNTAALERKEEEVGKKKKN